MPETIIHVENLSKLYKNNPVKNSGFNYTSTTFWALKDVNFHVMQGDIVNLSGDNGAGKSTLLKILSRITSPTFGKITGFGRINSLLEVGAGFHPELTGIENIYLNGAMLLMNKAQIKLTIDKICDFAGISKHIHVPVKRYSTGMYMRLAFSMAMHLESEILILDEILAVGDHSFQQKCLKKIKDINSKQGRTILMVDHNNKFPKNLYNKQIKLINGRIEL
ncbi:ABC transporter ATP-binding protein [Pedobacter frigoris]|uniref:ABC transporter ATP-binding protein n=2 Tax=Pedobacter frigoris TaxID=2571272 RepID=A0A4U1CMH2_9SPHI|nr:ABC transporter ATP-binding protein [Pedobacter frigoris]